MQAAQKSVYPRWRGELGVLPQGRGILSHTHHRIQCARFTSGKTAPYCAGLSPLARGTPPALDERQQEWRFIPAGAGNSQYHYIKECRIPVYPRWRGELFSGPAFQPWCRGLSPLARGTLNNLITEPQPQRFIPAGAGNSELGLLSLIKYPVYPRWRGELT